MSLTQAVPIKSGFSIGSIGFVRVSVLGFLVVAFTNPTRVHRSPTTHFSADYRAALRLSAKRAQSFHKEEVQGLM